MADTRLSLTLRNERSELGRLYDLVERFGTALRVNDDDLHAIHLMLDEAVINVMRHGYGDSGNGTVRVALALDDGAMRIVVDDDGVAFDPLSVPTPDLDAPIETRGVGGLGVHLIRSLAGSVAYRREHDRNVLTMIRPLTPLATGDAGA